MLINLKLRLQNQINKNQIFPKELSNSVLNSDFNFKKKLIFLNSVLKDKNKIEFSEFQKRRLEIKNNPEVKPKNRKNAELVSLATLFNNKLTDEILANPNIKGIIYLASDSKNPRLEHFKYYNKYYDKNKIPYRPASDYGCGCGYKLVYK
jgi:hypothetical protein